MKSTKLQFKNNSRKGQVMILSIITLGAIMLGATAVSGFLVVYQLRMSSDAADSAKAIFAADAGIDWGIYQFSKPTSTAPAPVFSNRASFVLACYDSASRQVQCSDSSSVFTIRSSGRSGMSNRAFELGL
ncbi:MAG: hypothetical protein Q8O66_02825 [bacterium]|nr:hypothetical protein [bacterium]